MKQIIRSTSFKRACVVFVLLFFVMTNQGKLSADENQAKTSDEDLVKKLDQLSAKIERLEGKVQDLDEKLSAKNALEISGFFDVSFSNYKNKPNVFAMGNLELDLEHSYDNKFQVAAALVFDDENGTYLGVGLIDYAFIGGPVPPRGRLFIERGLHIQVGRFDVPLGNDWNYVSAVNRITVTPPLTTSNLMEGVYNDVGIRVLYSAVALNFSLYSTHGIEKQYSYGGISYGTRIGLTPFNNPYTIKQQSTPVFELGFSYLYDIDNQGEKSEQVIAVDYESKSGPLILRSEYYNREKTVGVVFEGYHLTSGLDFQNINSSPFIIFLRYDYHLEKNNVITSDDTAATEAAAEGESLSRITGGVKFNISNTSFLKLEYHTYLTAAERFREDAYFAESLYYAQLVITF
ncbi:hypothetical protein KKA14_12935 [bacterium]|nr:hypothetical protein [bacterium]